MGSDEVTRAVGARIRRARRRASLTIEALAERADLASSYLSKIERARQTPSIAVLAQVARALEVDLASLVDLRDEVPVMELRDRALEKVGRLDARQLRALLRWLDAIDL